MTLFGLNAISISSFLLMTSETYANIMEQQMSK